MIYLELIAPGGFALIALILALEARYYKRHPEKERPEVSMWP